MSEERKGNTVDVDVKKVKNRRIANTYDDVATEEPLEMRVYYRSERRESWKSVSITMRTPGNDFELSAGFLFTEGIISSRDDIERISYCTDESEPQQYNIVNVYLNPQVHFDPISLERHFYTTSSCGVCGKASLDTLRRRGCRKIVNDKLIVRDDVVKNLPNALRKAQTIFNRTGGLHASGLFDSAGRLQVLREDVGRHNALDKLIGSQLLSNKIPLHDKILVVSGRTSFEITQKSLVAEIPVVIAVGAPSSLAVELSREFNMTLIGFVRDDGFNIYSGSQRVLVAETAEAV